MTNTQPGTAPRRQLAAIMFTDVAGYTAMMQSDEARAMSQLTRYRAVLQTTLAAHNGELLQHIGDGSLTMFQSTVDAVACAVDLQRALSEEPQVSVRAGIHLGDVVIEPDSIYGDGVNIASRIEQLADPGSILISQAVHESIKNHRRFRTKYLGAPRLRNVMAPTPVYAIRNRGIVVPDRLTRHVSIDTRSLARVGTGLLALLVLSLLVFGATQLFSRKKYKADAPLPVLVIDPVKNHTGNPAWNEIGELAAQQLGRTLVNARVVQLKAAGSPDAREYSILQCGYYHGQDAIVFQCMLVNGRTGEIVTVFDPQISGANDPAASLDALAEVVMGYITTTGRGNKRTAKSPRYSAYTEFAKGRLVVYDNVQEAMTAFASATEKDPAYIAPRIALLHCMYLKGDMQSLRDHLTSFSNRDELMHDERRILQHWELLLAGKYQRAYDTLYTLLDTAEDEPFVRMQLASLAHDYLRLPRTAIALLQPLIQQFDSRSGMHRAAFLLYQSALFKANRYAQLIDETRAGFDSLTHPLVLQDLVRAHCRLEQHQELRRLMDDCKNGRLPFACRTHRIAFWAAQEFYLTGDTSSMQHYVSVGLGMTQESRAGEAVLHYMGRHYHTAAAMYRESAMNAPDDAWRIDGSTMAAIARWHGGDSTALVMHWQTLDSLFTQHNAPAIYYHRGRLAAAEDDRDVALQWLEKAVQAGMPYRYGCYDTDIFLAPLFRENRFLRLTEARD